MKSIFKKASDACSITLFRIAAIVSPTVKDGCVDFAQSSMASVSREIHIDDSRDPNLPCPVLALINSECFLADKSDLRYASIGGEYLAGAGKTQRDALTDLGATLYSNMVLGDKVLIVDRRDNPDCDVMASAYAIDKERNTMVETHQLREGDSRYLPVSQTLSIDSEEQLVAELRRLFGEPSA